MENKLTIYNTLSRKKELFEPINPPFVGLYVCGPTVYGDAHLGHARPAITFDLLFRYLKFMGYRVRYVRNITDVGHLVNDADEGEDKIAKKASVTTGAIYIRYKNKDALFASLLQDFLRKRMFSLRPSLKNMKKQGAARSRRISSAP